MWFVEWTRLALKIDISIRSVIEMIFCKRLVGIEDEDFLMNLSLLEGGVFSMDAPVHA